MFLCVFEGHPLNLVVWLLLLVCAVSLFGCAGNSSPRYTHPAHIDKRIIALKNGASVGEVKTEVGEPESEFSDEHGRTTLNYVGWQLVFGHDQLITRIHEIKRLDGIPAGGPTASKVLELRLGMSVREVVRRLGMPHVVEVEYGSRELPERILRYGPWELRFRRGVLRFRAQS